MGRFTSYVRGEGRRSDGGINGEVFLNYRLFLLLQHHSFDRTDNLITLVSRGISINRRLDCEVRSHLEE